MSRSVALLIVAAVTCPAVAYTKPIILHAQMTGAAEVPVPGPVTAQGTAVITLKPEKNEVCYKLTSVGLDTPTMAHIHTGAAGIAGPVAVMIEPPVDGHVQGCKSADASVIASIAANPEGYYVNVHNAAYPKGGLRGQLMR